MALPEAIRKMTSFPAQRIGLADRGILRDGMKADITVFPSGECAGARNTHGTQAVSPSVSNTSSSTARSSLTAASTPARCRDAR